MAAKDGRHDTARVIGTGRQHKAAIHLNAQHADPVVGGVGGVLAATVLGSRRPSSSVVVVGVVVGVIAVGGGGRAWSVLQGLRRGKDASFSRRQVVDENLTVVVPRQGGMCGTRSLDACGSVTGHTALGRDIQQVLLIQGDMIGAIEQSGGRAIALGQNVQKCSRLHVIDQELIRHKAGHNQPVSNGINGKAVGPNQYRLWW